MRRVQSSPSRFCARRRSLLGAVVLALVTALQAAGSSALADEPIPEFRVVVHAGNPTRTADRAFLADAFLKKVTRWGEGEAIRPADLRPSAAARRSFTERVLKRSVGAVRSYWQQRIFSGRDVPPPET